MKKLLKKIIKTKKNKRSVHKGGNAVNANMGRNANTTRNSKKFKYLKCSPKPVGQTKKHKSNTCYENKNLIDLKNQWNERNPNDKIMSDDVDVIWESLKTKLSDVCESESCWYRKLIEDTSVTSDKKINLDDLFAPVSPKKWIKSPNEWLSSTDINKVMNQYSKIYKCFKFIGPSPIDYDYMESENKCVWDELCKFNLQQHIDNGKFKIGVIFNTDTHDGPGIHWVSLFINVKKGFIFYFDSGGAEILPNIKKLVDSIINQGRELSTPIQFKFDQNYPKTHQYTTTECGMYSLYFIVHMLEDKLTGNYLKTHVIHDKYVQKFRKIYYNETSI